MKFCSTEIELLSLDMFKNYLLSFRDESIVLILSSFGVERWDLSSTISILKSRNIVNHIFNKIENPTQNDIYYAIKQIVSKPDCIIAIGGGSSIDLAKGISAFYPYSKEIDFSEKTINSIIFDKSYVNNSDFIHIIAVPTTAGTGSEVTQWATIWDDNTKEKLSIDCENLKPKKAIIVSEFLYTLPNKILLSTSLDALSHAMEAFWAKTSNDLIKDIAIKAIQLIADNLPLALEDEWSAKNCLVRASVIAGLSFSQTRTTACHAISYPLTAIYGIEHGIAVAMTLNSILEINRKVVPRMNEIDVAFVKCSGFDNWLTLVTKNLASLNLSSYGVKKSDLINLTERCCNKTRLENNPIVLSKKDIYTILVDLL